MRRDDLLCGRRVSCDQTLYVNVHFSECHLPGTEKVLKLIPIAVKRLSQHLHLLGLSSVRSQVRMDSLWRR